MNIVFLDRSTVGDVTNLDSLERYGEVTFYETTTADETSARIEKAEIVITNKVIIDRKAMDAAPGLTLICIAATGMNNVDLEHAEKKGIDVRNVSGYSTTSVTQSTFAMVLGLINSINYYDNYVKSGGYAGSPIFTHHGRTFRELKGMVYGIIGMGAIGQSVARIAESFGCKVIYYSTTGENTDQPYEQVSMDILLETSDIISIHAPLNENTRNLMDLEKIRLMKKDSVLINAGRGNIVNEKDLAYALDHDLIAGAGLDVFSSEPIDRDNPLLKIKNQDKLILTPHIAWASREARELLIQKICGNIESFIQEKR